MCLGMNDDIVPPGGRCASTSYRNFEGRQGNGARTHLVSPEMAAAAAINGHFVDVRQHEVVVLREVNILEPIVWRRSKVFVLIRAHVYTDQMSHIILSAIMMR